MRNVKPLRIVALTISIAITILAGSFLIQRYLPETITPVGIENEVEGIADQTVEESEDIVVVEPQIPQDNRIIISKISVDASIVEGENELALDIGMWHLPDSSTPNKGGNTVITGHRFLYTSGPNTFFNLDKVTIDDTILVYWEGKEYKYKIYEITIVTPDRVDIEANTNESILTLYTCTPLWTNTKRLVIKAILQLENPDFF